MKRILKLVGIYSGGLSELVSSRIIFLPFFYGLQSLINHITAPPPFQFLLPANKKNDSADRPPIRLVSISLRIFVEAQDHRALQKKSGFLIKIKMEEILGGFWSKVAEDFRWGLEGNGNGDGGKWKLIFLT